MFTVLKWKPKVVYFFYSSKSSNVIQAKSSECDKLKLLLCSKCLFISFLQKLQLHIWRDEGQYKPAQFIIRTIFRAQNVKMVLETHSVTSVKSIQRICIVCSKQILTQERNRQTNKKQRGHYEINLLFRQQPTVIVFRLFILIVDSQIR